MTQLKWKSVYINYVMNKSYAAKSRPIIATKYEPSIMRAINISRERSSNDYLHAIPSKPTLPEMKLIPT